MRREGSGGAQKSQDVTVLCWELQAEGLQSVPLVHETPCRHSDCLADSDGCRCKQYQQLYCSQAGPATHDATCAPLQHDYNPT